MTPLSGLNHTLTQFEASRLVMIQISPHTLKMAACLAPLLRVGVIRKLGNRPGSPTTSVKSIEEKRKLEQGQGRKERAERRVRCGSEPPSDDSSSSLTSEDEEDYKSPERAERPEKRQSLGRRFEQRL
jgi:hypothetical protein